MFRPAEQMCETQSSIVCAACMNIAEHNLTSNDDGDDDEDDDDDGNDGDDR